MIKKKSPICPVCGDACAESHGIHSRCVPKGSLWLTMMWLYLGIQGSMKSHPGLSGKVAWKSTRYAARRTPGAAGMEGRPFAGGAAGRRLPAGR